MILDARRMDQLEPLTYDELNEVLQDARAQYVEATDRDAIELKSLIFHTKHILKRYCDEGQQQFEAGKDF